MVLPVKLFTFELVQFGDNIGQCALNPWDDN